MTCLLLLLFTSVELHEGTGNLAELIVINMCDTEYIDKYVNVHKYVLLIRNIHMVM